MKYGRPMPTSAIAASATSGCCSSKREEAAAQRQAGGEHRRQDDEKNQPLRALTAPQVAGAGDEPGRHGDDQRVDALRPFDCRGSHADQFTLVPPRNGRQP